MPDRSSRPLTHAQQLDALRDEAEILRAQAESLRERSVMLREQSMALRTRRQTLLQRVADTLEQGLRVQEQIWVFWRRHPWLIPHRMRVALHGRWTKSPLVHRRSGSSAAASLRHGGANLLYCT